ncbi:MAG TPA: DUF4380 domain-containing protein [Cytophagales bacterium]|nr:DUF4380 domain-containing protein [Cytophagales bacterium]
MSIKTTLAWASLVLMVSCSDKPDSATVQKTDSLQATKDSTAPILPEVVVLHSGNLTMKVDPLVGARIVSFAMDSTEALIQKEQSENYGTTFWTAPQSDWGWPPIAAIDALPYTKTADHTYESQQADTLGITVSKKFVANADSTFTVTYTIKNNSDSALKIAPWEISRVATGGITIFPTERFVYKGKKPFGELKITSKDGISLFKYDSAAVNDNKKSFAYASEGWLAQHKGNLLLIKKFANIKPSECAPNESEIEIYANPNKSYIEIEQQGAYRELKPTESYTWDVVWYLRKVNSNKYSEKEYKVLIESILD